MMSALSYASARFIKMWISFVNDLLDGYLCKILLISIFSLFFLIFYHDFIVYIDFTHITASNIASDDVTNYVTHRIRFLNTEAGLIYSRGQLSLLPSVGRGMSSISVARWMKVLAAVSPSSECLYEGKADVVYLQVALCDPHLSA